MNGEKLLERVKFYTGDHTLQGYSHINDAYETILRRAGMWLTRVRDETSLVFKNGLTKYTLPMSSIRRLEGIWIQDNEDFQEWRELQEVTEGRFEETVFQYREADGTNTKDSPYFYRLHMGDANQLEVTPTPDGTYPARLVYIGNPPEINGEITPVLPENYHRIIAKLAAANWLEDHPSEVNEAKANRLHRDVRESYFPLAVDVSANRAGVARPKQKIMRA